MGEANKAVVVRIGEELLNAGDRSAFDELVHPDYRDGYGGFGRVEYRELLLGMRETFPDLHLRIEQLVAEGDLVVGRFTFTGTHQGEFLGVPPTGRHVEFPVIGVIRIEDGRMIERWNVSDALGAVEQLKA